MELFVYDRLNHPNDSARLDGRGQQLGKPGAILARPERRKYFSAGRARSRLAGISAGSAARSQDIAALGYCSAGTAVPLHVQLNPVDPSVGKSATNVWIDRVLIQGQQLDNMQRYRTQLALRKWTTRSLELELPAGTSDIEAFLDGRPDEIREAVAENERTRIIRVQLPVWQEGVGALIELRYRVPLARVDGISAWTTRWFAPRPRPGGDRGDPMGRGTTATLGCPVAGGGIV